MSLKCCIIDSSEVEDMNFSDLIECCADTLVYNLDQTQTFVHYEGHKPRCLYGKTVYEIDNFLSIRNDPDNGWVDNSVL